MQTSDYLIQELFYQPNYATYHCLERKSEVLFQCPGAKSFIEIHHQQRQSISSPAIVLDDDRISDCSSRCPTLLDQSRCSSLDQDPPPTYDNSSALLRQDIRDLEDVQRVETVSALLIAWSTLANTHGEKGNKTLFPYMVSEYSKPSQRLPFR